MTYVPNQTIQALRQVFVAALTSPPLTFLSQTGATETLATTSVIPKSIWLATPAASPLIAFDVSSRGSYGRLRNERELEMRMWVVSTSGPDECTMLYEAVRARIQMADQETDGLAADLSRVASGIALGIAVRLCVEETVLPVDFESSTQRWYINAIYRIVAN